MFGIRRLQIGAIAALLVVVLSAQAEARVKKVDPRPKGTAVVNAVLKALMIADEGKRIAALVPHLHKSLLTKDGKHLTRTVKDYSFKKASSGVKFYKIPAEITEVHEGNVFTIGFKETAERGQKFKYFVAKKEGAVGRPAPIAVFFPEGGGAAKVIDIGSL